MAEKDRYVLLPSPKFNRRVWRWEARSEGVLRAFFAHLLATYRTRRGLRRARGDR